MKNMKFRNILLDLSLFLPIALNAGVVTGRVTDTNGTGLSGIPISDGREIVLTDSDGRYILETDKRMGYVFVITPSGYEPAHSHANLPDFWNLITTPVDENDIIDFILTPTDDSKFAFLGLADNQLTNRSGEVNCFKSTTIPDVNVTIDSLRKEGYNPFVIMLGDQAHDCYWKKNRYGLQEAYSDLEAINSRIYSVIGNHDHDPSGWNDYEATWEWRRNIGPTYYSFNKGGVHFVVLDDIEIVDGSPEKSKDGECVYTHHLSSDQLEWLKKDLSLVDKSNPLIIALHAPLYAAPGANTTYRVTNGEELVDLIKDFDSVEVISGHTHISYGAESEDKKIHETNYGAVCGSWWLNARVDLGNDNNICRDGTPSGYAIWTYDDGKFSNIYKGTGLNRNHQFRTYDLNNVIIDNDQIAGEFLPDRMKDNEVLINVWGYGPGWTVEAFENGESLNVERVRSKDPLFLSSCPMPYLEKGFELIGTVRPVYTMHMFKVKASKPDSTIDIKVTDREGRVYSEKMVRPKAFTLDM